MIKYAPDKPDINFSHLSYATYNKNINQLSAKLLTKTAPEHARFEENKT